MHTRVHIFVSGRVQGVFFRASAARVAESHGVKGFAKNLADGRVEIVAEGSESGLRALVDWCYRGSLLAHVDSLSFAWEESKDEFQKFDVAREEGNIVLDQVLALTNLGRRALNRVDRKARQILPAQNLPKHVVIIPDGNRRWAKERGLPAWEGHRQGIERAKEIMRLAKTAGIKNLSFWGFSTENWDRPKEEVSWLMTAYTATMRELGKQLVENEIGFRHLGRKDRIAPGLLAEIVKLEELTKGFTERTLSVALDYGGRDEILRAVHKAGAKGATLDEASMNAALDTAGLPDPDLIIRTSGEQRTSGLMPWQGTYAELYFTPLHFPDFTGDEFALALADYSSRTRRFGA